MIKQKIAKYDLVTVGGITRDILFYSKEGELVNVGQTVKQKLLAFEYGAKIYADRVFMEFGGGADNVAIASSRLGLKSALIARIGDDENGQSAIKNLKDNRVDFSYLKKDTASRTGFSVVLTVNNTAKEHVAFLHRGANEFLSAKDLPENLETNWIYIASLPKNGWEAIMTKIIKMKKNLVWNPGKQQLEDLPKLKKFLPSVKIFIVNHEEASEFKKLKDIKSLITHIKACGPELVIITDGEKGAYAHDGKKYYFIKAKKTKPVNTLGVGDAFGASLTSAFICGKNIKTALEWGIKNSASVVGHIGAQKGLLSKKQIER
ncbi:MAG: carbohydrate kinase family protein [bacterium]